MFYDEPKILKFKRLAPLDDDPIVITGIGMAASVGSTRESVWKAVQTGRSGVRMTHAGDGVGSLELPCGMVDWLPTGSSELKSIRMTRRVSSEALDDANIPWETVDRQRFACSISAQFGDIGYLYMPESLRNQENIEGHQHAQWFNNFLPCSASTLIAEQFGLHGPRLCHATACASGLISTIMAARMIQSDQADYALCGAADAVTEIVLAAFNRLGVLSHGPDAASACRPFDKTRSGFVMGEGAAMLVLEKRSHAMARGATIYAELAASQMLCQAHHVTGLESEGDTLVHLIDRLIHKAGWSFDGPQYINAHGTGTDQNDRSELQAIRMALDTAADSIRVSSNKAVVGHLINAAGSLELALTALSLRDGFAPPTMFLDQPETIGNIDCLAGVGEKLQLDRALKLSLAFGGHLVGMALQRSSKIEFRRSALPLAPSALVREPQRLSKQAA